MQEPLVITYEMALKGLKAAVEDRGPDYYYVPFVATHDQASSCRYFDKEGQPSCIVGHVMANYGLPAFAFNSVANVTGIGALETKRVIALPEPRTMALLARAQMYQDTGSPWGIAVRQAIEQTENLSDADV